MKTAMKWAVVAAMAWGAQFASATPVIYWSSPYGLGIGSAPDVWDNMGVPVPTTSTFLAQLVRVSDGQVMFTGSSTFWSADGGTGVGYDAIPAITVQNSWNGMAFFTRIYNASTAGAATAKAETANTTLSWSDTPTPATGIDYNFGEVTQGMWTSIPEPMSAGFLLIGAGVVALRRMRNRN